MTKSITYIYKKEEKIIPFSYQLHYDIFEAVAKAENIDLTEFYKTEQRLKLISDGTSVKNYRDSYFKKLGFEKIWLNKKENLGVGKKKQA